MNDRGLEIKVGFFVLAGLVIIAAMAVQFGRLGQGMGAKYTIAVEFANAGGLFKDADVKLAGALVGHVASTPQPMPGKVDAVTVMLDIQEGIKFPVGSEFTIGSNGLLGDKFVQVAPPRQFNPQQFNPGDTKQVIQPGSLIKGSNGVGLDDLQEQGKITMEKMSANLDELRDTLAEIKTKVLSAENIENLRVSFASIKTTSENFASASKKADEVMDDAKKAVAGANQTIDMAKQAMGSVNATANDVHAAVGEARGVIQNADALLKNAQSGSGTLPMLLSNSELANNLQSLVGNLRRHGILFYRDSAPKSAPVNAANAAKAASAP
jgi:phospholipid/cholesterol/gamma-HCH transport system substrate-binding protein